MNTSTIEKIVFPNQENEMLAGHMHLPVSHSDKGIILSHCFTCSQHTSILKDIAIRLSELGFFVLRFDFSGNGKSEGDFADTSYSKHVNELKMAIRLLEQKGIHRIGLAGHSMGGSLSLICASQLESIKAVCILGTGDTLLYPEKFLDGNEQKKLRQNGYTAFTSRGRHLTIQDTFFRDADTYDIQKITKQFKNPLFIVHCEGDEITHVKAAQNLFQLKKEPKDILILPAGDHMFINKTIREKASVAVAAWFEEQFETTD